MANPRKLVFHDGIGYRAETFFIDASTIVFDATKKDGSVAAGFAVQMVPGTEDTVELTADAGEVLGKLLHVEADGGCAVQVEGVCRLPGANGATWTARRGAKIVGGLGVSNARGYIRPQAVATLAEVAVAKHTVQKIADTTSIEVMLGS